MLQVQIIDSVVYSNYSVRVQVIPSSPVASIQGGTNIFVSRNTVVSLDGQKSYDPDFPLNPVSFQWTCEPISSISSSCFHTDIPISSPVLKFPAGVLKQPFDQFRFVLTVFSSERSSSSEIFITLTPNVIRKASVLCSQCQGDRVNWDQSFTFSALCDGCDVAPEHIQLTWSLYLVNASSKPLLEDPLCHTVDLSTLSAEASQYSAASSDSAVVSGFEKVFKTRVKSLKMPNDSLLSKNERKKSSLPPRSGEEPFLGGFDPQDHLFMPPGHDQSGILDSDQYEHSNISGFPVDPGSSADWDFSFPVSESGQLDGQPDAALDIHLMSAEEGHAGISAGRPTVSGEDRELLGPEDLVPDPEEHEDEGSNLVDSRPSVVFREPILLDLSRELVEAEVFDSYTYTGTSSSLLSLRPFSLNHGSRYMLEVTARSHDSVLGRTQLFFQTNPVPDGMMCQVQPAKGLELFTHFSIFCASGKEDLTYKYSIRVADPAPRTLYQGTDYQYYFSLPSGDPLDDYKVTIYTEIRSSTYGTVTTPCPVSVQVLPHFSREASSSHFDPDLELSESGLRNLSALLPLGNSAEIRNYISLLTAILNRLSLEDGSNTRAQRRARNVLICTTCQLESGEQESMEDNINILRNLLQVTNQVTLVSARRVTGHIQAISRRFSKFGTSVQFSLDQQTLNTLVALLSHSLQATVRGNRTRISRRVDANGELEADLQEENIRKGRSIINSCELEEPLSAQHVVQLVTDVLEVTADLMLKYILLHEVQEHRVNSRLIVLHGRRQNQTAPVISGNLAALYLPDSLLLRLHVHHRGETESRPSQPCVLAILIEFSLSPFTWARHHERLNGPVVDLNLYQCSTRRKIPDFSLIEPVTVELQEQPREKNTSEHQHILQHRQVDYHSFNITQEHLQHAIQLRVHFRPPPNKVFPIMLLFRMFERPTPSMHHLSRTHRWEGNTVILTLPTSVLSTAGVGYLALLNADFAKSARRKDVSKQVRYSFRVDSSVCLSWDAQQGFWTHSSCRTMQTDATASVNCSCNQLRPTTVVQQEIHSSYDTSDVNLFFSMPSNLTVLCVLLLCVCPYVPGWVACKRADAISEENQRVHHLSDNCPHDQYLYAVTIHTGPCSAACMSAKVYIVLYGEDAVSQTKELQVPECTLFKRNSQDTFILSAADSLGPVWGVHIWHDNSGSSPSWYLKQVEVCEVSPGPVNKWLFVAQCWLAVDKDDGQVERTLRVCEQGITFAELLRLKLHDYLADYHIWMSVLSCPHPNPFTHTQRLCVSLLLLLGYAAVNIAVILKMEDQFDVAMIDVSALSVKTGVVSTLLVLPAVLSLSFLFRLREIKLTHLEIHQTNDSSEDVLSTIDGSSQQSALKVGNEEGIKASHEKQKVYVQQQSGLRPVSHWCHCLAWALSVLLCILCLVYAAILGNRLSGSQVLLWIHSLFFSLTSCIFLIQPAVIMTAAVIVSLWYKERADFHSFSTKGQFELSNCPTNLQSNFSANGSSDLAKLLRARQRLRYLRLVCPPTLVELRKSRRERRRDAVLLKTIRDLFFCGSMLFLMLCILQNNSLTDQHHLGNVIRKKFTSRGHDNTFMSIHTHEDWWKWAQSNLDLLYKDASAAPQSHVLIGEPILWKIVESCSFYSQDSVVNLLLKRLWTSLKLSRKLDVPGSTPMCAKTCIHPDCHIGTNATVSLGYKKSDALSILKALHSSGWLNRCSTVKLRFTLFSPASNRFTSVTMLAEQRLTGVMQPSAEVHTARVYHTPALWDYVVMVLQLLYILFSLLQLCDQVHTLGQQGIMGYWKAPCNWMEVGLLTVTLVYHIFCIYGSVLILEFRKLLQRQEGHVDVSLLATCEQHIRSLRGVMLFFLMLKSLIVLRVFRTMATSAKLLASSLAKLFWPMISGIILMVALSCMGNLLFGQGSNNFSTVVGSLQSLLCHHRGLRAVNDLHSSWGAFLFPGFYLSSTLVWMAAVLAVVSSAVTSARRCHHREDEFTVVQLAGYIMRRPKNLHVDNVEEKTYYFEEFESLLDELLFRLSALSNSLHHTLPPKAYHCREDSPVSSNISDHLDAQFFRMKKTEGSIEEILPASPLLLSNCEMDESQDLQLDFKNHLQRPEPTALTQPRGEIKQIEGNSSCWLSKNPAAQKEMLVEVLIHKEPSFEPRS
ncbi:polycystic kidney disease 1 like 1-like [Takifugu flavidus]|uniref:polycystic kidney disease 1 like 1-like n=1 Tax=Takifugu flavidus TaxID=433684 RepID=UPI0025444AA9|nr:polycystic kidney disease 1 like 1-like [Takifugu flavidus]